MSKKDLLLKKAKGKLAIDAPSAGLALVPRDKGGELRRITLEIQSDLSEMQEIANWWIQKKERVGELKQLIIEKLIYVQKNKKRLLGGRTFEDYLVNDVGISKGYFYEQLQAYSVCAEYGKTSLFKEVDPKVLVNIAREKDKKEQEKLIAKAHKLTRDDFKRAAANDSSDYAAEEKPVAKVNRNSLSIKVKDEKLLKQIEALLKANGIKLEYV